MLTGRLLQDGVASEGSARSRLEGPTPAPNRSRSGLQLARSLLFPAAAAAADLISMSRKPFGELDNRASLDYYS